MTSFRALLAHWFSFRGRIGRADFNSVNCLAMLLFIAASLVFVSPLFAVSVSQPVTVSMIPLGLNAVVAGVISVVAFAMALSSAVRRLHDFGRSGWWLAVTVVPVPGLQIIAGVVAVLILAVLRGEAKPNSYGSSAA